MNFKMSKIIFAIYKSQIKNYSDIELNYNPYILHIHISYKDYRSKITLEIEKKKIDNILNKIDKEDLKNFQYYNK